MSSAKPLALVTGAAGGIGSRVADELYHSGYRLHLADIKLSGLEQLHAKYPDSVISKVDLADEAETENFCRLIESSSESIHVAFINAGTVTPGNACDLERGQLNREVHINLRSAINLNHACAKKMKQQGYGHIINTVSVAGLVALRGAATYSASKFGLRGFLIALRAELNPFGVTVSGIFPGAIDTPMLRFEALNEGSALNFLGVPLTVDDVAKAFTKALRQKKLEYFLTFTDSITARLACSFPSLLYWLYPLLEKIGEKGRAKFIRQHDLR